MKKLLIVVSLALLSVQGAWAADKMLADRHVERGLKCESCHTTMPPKAVNTDGCLKCHVSYENSQQGRTKTILIRTILT